MAAATGYDDAPTDEQLLAYADLPTFGYEMAEVFAVRVPAAAGGNRSPPCGRISFHGGHCVGDCIYRRSPTDDATSPLPCDSQVRLTSSLLLISPSKVKHLTQNQSPLLLCVASIAAFQGFIISNGDKDDRDNTRYKHLLTSVYYNKKKKKGTAPIS